jgi:hypothetical protein
MVHRLLLACALLGGSVLRADDAVSFSKTLTPAEFAAAGLDKLTPEQRAELDALVRARQSGAVARAKEETAKVVTDTVRAQTTQEVTKAVTEQVRTETAKKVAAQKAASASLIDRMKVVLRPGTEIEYATLDATLAGPFHGWEKGRIFTLTNGQRWVVTDDERYWAPDSGKPVHVHITPGILGSFFMEIEDGGRPRVRFLGNINPPRPTPTPSP